MNNRFEKTLRILTDLLGYCRYLGATRFHTDFSMERDKTIVSISAKIEKITSQQLEELDTDLRIPRQPEVEQNYWNISGNEDVGADLSLVGMMVDESHIEYANNQLDIHVERNEY